MQRTTPSEADKWAVEAKRLHTRGEHEKALVMFRRSTEALPGRARVELDTAELARRLGRLELAVQHYRRAATAYANSGFARQAIAPLRTALHLEQSRLPAAAENVLTVARELADILIKQGFSADARQVMEQCAGAFSERGLAVPEPLASLLPPPPVLRQGLAPSATASGTSRR